MSYKRLLNLLFYVQLGKTRSAYHLKLRISHFLGKKDIKAFQGGSIGTGGNDSSMIKAAGIGVAMGNAHKCPQCMNQKYVHTQRTLRLCMRK